MAAKNLKGDPPLLKVCTDPLAEDNNQNFARGSHTEIFLVSLFKVVSVTQAEDNNQDFERGSPTEILFLSGFFVKGGMSSTN